MQNSHLATRRGSFSRQASSDLIPLDQRNAQSPGRSLAPDGMVIAATFDSGRGDRTFVSISCNTDWHTSPFFLLGLSMLVI